MVRQTRAFALRLIAALTLAASAQVFSPGIPASQAAPAAQAGPPTLAYIYNGTNPDAANYKSFLESRGFLVDLVPLNAITRTSFVSYSLILLADDSGRYPGDDEWFTWGSSQAETAAQMAPIIDANRPVLALGEGGSTYLEKRGLSNGWLHSWYRNGDDDLARAAGAPTALFSTPNAIVGDPLQVYSTNVSSLNVHRPRLSASALEIGTEIPDKQHASITVDGCHFAWGFRNSPSDMTAAGKDLFHNLVAYASTYQCPALPPPPTDSCMRIVKSAEPPNGAQVPVTGVGSVGLITYTLTYSVSANPACNNVAADLVDQLPPDISVLPGSTTDGIGVDASGRSLTWRVAAGSSGSKSFTAIVHDSACTAPDTLHNSARLLMPGRAPLTSNEVKHQAICPPVVGLNESPSFAQDEISVYPYPVIAGRAHTVSARLINRTNTAQTAVVSFETSPNAFGIGIPFTTFATRTLTLPPNGTAIVSVPATFAASGHFCIQIRVSVPGSPPYVSQRNLDTSENLRPGLPDTLAFKVGNPSGSLADIALEVDNTCPGFTAVVSPSLLTGMAAGEIRNASLTTTPPNPVTLGSGCHIDVVGYALIGGRRVPLGSGLRKLDVPPISA
jgi:hypothetical protein